MKYCILSFKVHFRMCVSMTWKGMDDMKGNGSFQGYVNMHIENCLAPVTV